MNDGMAQETLENLTLSFRAMGGGLWDYTIDGDVLLCNRRWYDILGLDPDITPVRSITDFRRHVHPDDVGIATTIDLAEVDRLLASDQTYGVDFRIIRPDGDVRWLRSVACLVEEQGTGRRHAVGCVTDITEFFAATSPVAAAGQADDARDAPGTAAGITLSRRERECLMWVSLGKTAWETACILGRSQRTVEFHLNNAVAKLQASNKIHAAALAIRQGLL